MIAIGRWAIALERKSGDTFIRFEFTDKPPLEFAIPKEQAEELARAILNQYSSPPGRQN